MPMPRNNKGAPEPTRDQGVTTNSDQDNEPSPSAPPRTGASSAAIRRHYDLSDGFFQLWLDPLMIYSCAHYDGTADPASDIRQRMDFIADSIFPESELPCIWEPIAAAGGPFELVVLRNDGDHYFLTLRQWERNLVARRAEASALVGEEAFENVRQYLRISAAAYRYRRLSLLRMSFVRTP
jgi:cyclopropane fatty-acyl-phospholipid synthase-like methyltransferase